MRPFPFWREPDRLGALLWGQGRYASSSLAGFRVIVMDPSHVSSIYELTTFGGNETT